MNVIYKKINALKIHNKNIQKENNYNNNKINVNKNLLDAKMLFIMIFMQIY